MSLRRYCWFQCMVMLALSLALIACREAREPPPVPTATPSVVELLREDSNKPRFSGVVAGITLYGDAPPGRGPEVGCPEPLQLREPLDIARGTPFQIEPAYSPPNVPYVYSEGGVTLCQGKIIGAGRFWAPISVQRVLRPEPWNYSHAPPDRISACSINAIPAVCVRPVVLDGRGGSVVTFVTQTADGYVVTQVNAEIPLDEAIKVAEGLR